jgi:dihydroneopterin aldolase
VAQNGAGDGAGDGSAAGCRLAPWHRNRYVPHWDKPLGFVKVKQSRGMNLASAGMTEIWSGSRNYRRIILRNVQVEARVGLHPWEMHPERPARLIVNVEMFVSLADGAEGETAETIVNYDAIRDALRTWPRRPHTPLLETLVDELAGLCLAHPRVMACRVSIMKPDIFNEAEGVGIEVYRTQAADPHQAAAPAMTDRGRA